MSNSCLWMLDLIFLVEDLAELSTFDSISPVSSGNLIDNSARVPDTFFIVMTIRSDSSLPYEIRPKSYVYIDKLTSRSMVSLMP